MKNIKKVENVKKLDNPSLTIRISPEMNDRLERVADMYGVARGEVARMAIGQYVGQITGTLDQMAKNSQAQAQAIDVDKMIQAMIPKMMESFGGQLDEAAQGKKANFRMIKKLSKLSDDELKEMEEILSAKKGDVVPG